MSGAPSALRVALALGAVYLFWGSTAPAMKLAVQTLPPFALVSVRFLAGGSVLWLIARLRRVPLPQQREWATSLVTASLLLVASNALFCWSLQTMPSGLGSLFFALSPLWMTLFAAAFDGERIVPLAIAGLVLGIGGMLAIFVPGAAHGLPLSGIVVDLFASVAWALGSIVQRRFRSTDLVQTSAMQMLLAAPVCEALSLATAEHPRRARGVRRFSCEPRVSDRLRQRRRLQRLSLAAAERADDARRDLRVCESRRLDRARDALPPRVAQLERGARCRARRRGRRLHDARAAPASPARRGGLSERRETRAVRICVFCGSSAGRDPAYAEAARSLGAAIVAGGDSLVYGGGSVGLMGVVADAVLFAGGRAVGVIPQALAAPEVAHAGLSDLHVVGTMHERKAMMADLSDAFLALPGGFGTFEEFLEIVTWAQLRLHRKPCVLVNVTGYYDALVASFDLAVAAGFLAAPSRALVRVAASPAEALALVRG